MQYISQYYGMAAIVILLYDHLLTLADEVSQVYSISTPGCSPLRPCFVEDKIYLVWQEITHMGCVDPQMYTCFC